MFATGREVYEGRQGSTSENDTMETVATAVARPRQEHGCRRLSMLPFPKPNRTICWWCSAAVSSVTAAAARRELCRRMETTQARHTAHTVQL